MRPRPFLRDRLSFPPRYQACRNGNLQYGGRILQEHPQPGIFLFQDQVRGRAAKIQRLFGDWCDQRHRCPASSDEFPSGTFRYRDRRQGQQSGCDFCGSAFQEPAFERVQQREDQSHRTRLPSDHPGQGFRGGHRECLQDRQRLLYHASADRGRNHRSP